MEVLSEDGKTYTVRPFRLSRESVHELWKTFQKHSTLLEDHYRGNLDIFLNYVMDPSVIILEVLEEGEEVVGVFYADEIKPKSDAKVHYVFFDKRTKGRQKLFLNVLKYFMVSFQLPRVSIEAPTFAYAALNRIRSLGFWLEGRKRKAALYDGKWCDKLQFSVLYEDLTEENLERATLDPERMRGRWKHVLADEEQLARYFLRKEELDGNAA